MSLFKEIEGSAAVLVENGVYEQVPLFQRDGFIFAKAAGGFVKLMADGTTTKAGGRLRLDFMTIDEPLCRDPLGRLCLPSATEAMSLDGDTERKLLGAPV